MLPNDKIFNFLCTFSNMCENRTQHQFDIKLDSKSYKVDGYFLTSFIEASRHMEKPVEFYLWRGCMFAITYLYGCSIEGDTTDNYFTLFWLGPKFVIDQNSGVELPEEYYDDIKRRLDIGF